MFPNRESVVKEYILGRLTPNVSMGRTGGIGHERNNIFMNGMRSNAISDDDGDDVTVSEDGDGHMDDDIVELSDEDGDYYDENGRNVSQEDDADDWEDLEF